MLHDISYHFISDELSRFQRRRIGRVVSGNHFLQTLRRRHAWGFSVVVADSAQHEHSLQINPPSLTQET